MSTPPPLEKPSRKFNIRGDASDPARTNEWQCCADPTHRITAKMQPITCPECGDEMNRAPQPR